MNETSNPKRRVLYVRHKRVIDIATGFKNNQDEWCEAMSLAADVVVVDKDFDLHEACEKVQPDFILYESPLFISEGLIIKNIDAFPEIPRIGFMIQDPFSPVRVNFLRAAASMNVQWIFSQLTEAVCRQSPELRRKILSINLFFDDDIFHDYGLSKDIPVSVFGGFLEPEFYNWRAETARQITEHFPTLIYTHPGYTNPVPRHKFAVFGEAYARLLSRSHFSLADGTRLDYLVRKHLEIPAAGAVLIAPDASALRPYGFRDMENCILGSGDELWKKMARVADDPELYQSIRHKGYDLVHGRYSRKNWRGILDFYECLRGLKEGETVGQQGLLGPFHARPASQQSLPPLTADISDSEISLRYKQWLSAILGEQGGDQDLYAEAPRWFMHMEESYLFVGLSVLLKGHPDQARDLILEAHALRKKGSGFEVFDPEEITWLSLIAALTGDQKLLELTRREAAGMNHISLRRMRWLRKVLTGESDLAHPPASVQNFEPNDQLSIHWIGQLNIRQWLGIITRILSANGQQGLELPEERFRVDIREQKIGGKIK